MQDISSKTKKRSYARSSSFLMALLFTILCGAVAITLGYFINYFAKGHFVHSTQAVIDSEIKYVESLGRIPDHRETLDRIYLAMGQKGQLPEDFPTPKKGLSEGLLVFEMPKTSRKYAARIHTMGDGRKILIGTDITDMAHDFDFMQWIGIASIAFVMMVVFVSYLISIFVVNGTNKISGTAHDIIRTGDLSRRVKMNSRWDDLGNVAGVLNTLFDRIEELMNGVRQVSDNIAHDLRTPLTRMRHHIEALQQKDPANKDYTKLLHEADHILNTFNALLRISRIETERQRSRFSDVALNEILADVCEFYEPLAEADGIAFSYDIDVPASVNGDRDLLFQAFANILDNAMKYTPEGGSVALRIHKQSDATTIVIENSGAPLDEEDLPKIFDRFYRVDKSRNEPGTGLGLSLVAAVIGLHGGSVRAENADQGVQIITIL